MKYSYRESEWERELYARLKEKGVFNTKSKMYCAALVCLAKKHGVTIKAADLSGVTA